MDSMILIVIAVLFLIVALVIRRLRTAAKDKAIAQEKEKEREEAERMRQAEQVGRSTAEENNANTQAIETIRPVPLDPQVTETVSAPDGKQAHSPAPEKDFIGETITGNGWRIFFDGASNRTRVIFDSDPTDAARAALEKAGFYYSQTMNSYNKKLTFKAHRAALDLANELRDLYVSEQPKRPRGRPRKVPAPANGALSPTKKPENMAEQVKAQPFSATITPNFLHDNPFLDYWGTEIHSDTAHKNSIDKALKGDTSPVPDSLDREKRMCLFPAEKGTVHTTTLYECDCGAQTRPCKHMYRLAMELGLYPGNFKTGVNKNLQLSSDEALPLISSMPDICQEKVREFLYIVLYSKDQNRDKPFCVEASDEYAPLLSCPLLSPVPVTADALYDLYPTKHDIFPFLDRAAPNAPRELSKRKLFQWCAENIPDSFYAFTFVPDFRNSQRTVYQQLLKKYPRPDGELVTTENGKRYRRRPG